MNIKEFEDLILSELENIVDQIIVENLALQISAKARAGAEVSDFLEDKFIECTLKHKFFTNSEAAPKGQTKNPWDVKTFFKINSHLEQIWIDFKALKTTSADSNPDIGTPDKVIKFIEQGNFYLVYIYVYYQEKDDGLEFVKHDNRYTKLYFLKDISSTVRRNPKNQLQVNMSEEPEYRTREEFIKLLFDKIKESHIRQVKISEKKLKELDKIEENLLKINRASESGIIKKI